MRNIAEHWFKPATAEDEAALALLTGCGAEETRRGQASAEAAAQRAEVRPSHINIRTIVALPSATTMTHAACHRKRVRAGARAQAVPRYFLCPKRFADLLVVFHMPAACA